MAKFAAKYRRIMKTSNIFSLLVVLLLSLASCGGGDEPAKYISKADVTFRFEPNEAFLDYFTILAYYKSADGKDNVRGVDYSPFVTVNSYRSLPVSSKIQFQFIRNNRPTPIESIEFRFDLTKIATVTATGMSETTQRVETYNVTVTPMEFESWAKALEARNYTFSLGVERSGVVVF